MYRFSLFAATLLFVVGCQQNMPQDAEALTDVVSSQIKKEITELNEQLIEAGKNFDFLAKFESLPDDNNYSL